MRTWNTFQRTIDGVSHEIQLRADGYFNASAMCAGAGKRWNHYHALQQTQRFIVELAHRLDVPGEALVIRNATGQNDERQTWVHQQIAVALAMWISTPYSVWVTELVVGTESFTKPLERLEAGGCIYFAEIPGAFSNVKAFDRVDAPIETVQRWCTVGRSEDLRARIPAYTHTYKAPPKVFKTIRVSDPEGAENALKRLLEAQGLRFRGRHHHRTADDTELVPYAPTARNTVWTLMEEAAAMFPIVEDEEEPPRTKRKYTHAPVELRKQTVPLLEDKGYGEATLTKYNRELRFIYASLSTDISFQDLARWMDAEYEGILSYCQLRKTGNGKPYRWLSMLDGIALKNGDLALYKKYKAAAKKYGL